MEWLLLGDWDFHGKGTVSRLIVVFVALTRGSLVAPQEEKRDDFVNVKLVITDDRPRLFAFELL